MRNRTTIERTAFVLACALLLAAGWLLRAPLHRLPLERDEGAYAAIAWRWTAGEMLYRDLFDHKPPLVHALYAPATLLPGDPVGNIRVTATLLLLFSAAATLALGARLYGPWAGLAAGALVLAYGSGRSFQGLSFNSEAVMLLPATLGCLFATTAVAAPRRRWGLLAGAGLCVGLAVLSKPVAGLLLLPLALAAWLAGETGRGRLAGLAVALASAAGLPALLVALLWFQGALPAAVEALVGYNQLYAAESAAIGWDPRWLWRTVWAPMLPLAAPALLGLALASAFPRWRTRAHGIAAAWGAALLATALLSLRAYPHYYLVAVPLLGVWAGALVAALGQILNGRVPRWLAVPLGVALVAALALPPIRELWPLRELAPREQIVTLYAGDGEQFFAAAGEVAAYVAARTTPDQAIWVWAAEPQIYYLARRRPAARYVYDYPVDRLPNARAELLGRLETAPPPVIITYRDVRPIGLFPFADDYGYRLHATIGGFDLFWRDEQVVP